MMFQILSLGVLALALASVNAEFIAEECTDPCNCNDVSWSGKFSYPYEFTVKDPNGQTYNYVFSPCGAPINCGNTTKPVVICQIDSSMSAHVVIGASSSVVWSANASDTDHFTVTYGDGDMTQGAIIVPRKAVVSVTVTTQDKASFDFISEDPPTTELDYNFAAKIPPGGGVPSGYIGLIFIFLTLGAVMLYFIIGAIIMFVDKGARGVEVVPNYTFWKDLPFLIKDGFMFMLQPCLGGCSKKNTYSSLS